MALWKGVLFKFQGWWMVLARILDQGCGVFFFCDFTMVLDRFEHHS